MIRASIRKPNSAGLFTSTVGNDLLHILGTNRSGVTRTAIIRKILVNNNTGGNIILRLGTRDFTAVPLFVQYLPDLLAINGLENIWTEEDIPAVEFSVLTLLLANGREGNIYSTTWVAPLGVVAVLGLVISLEIEEFGS